MWRRQTSESGSSSGGDRDGEQRGRFDAARQQLASRQRGQTEPRQLAIVIGHEF